MGTFHVHNDFHIKVASIVNGQAGSSSVLHCLVECFNTCGCVAVNTLKNEPYLCEIVLHDNKEIISKMPDPEWDVYSFIYV